MKKILPILFLLVLAGAGCSASPSSKKPDGGILKTGDAGKTWVSASVVPSAKGIGTLTTANILKMEMDPEDNAVLYVGTREDGFLFSDDAGASWHQPRNKDLATGLISSIKVNPKNVCTVYIAKGARLYKTTDCMRTFSSDTYVESRAGVGVSHIALDWFDPDTIWVALSNGDVQKSPDGGSHWTTALNLKDTVTDFLISNADSRVMLIGTAKSGMQKSTDGGATWSRVADTLHPSGLTNVYDLVQTKSGDVVLAATGYGLVRSTDFGTTWSPIKLVTQPGQVTIRAVGMDQYNPSQIYYATTATFYQSSDSGVTWKTGKLPSLRVPRALVVDPKQSSVVYIGEASEVK